MIDKNRRDMVFRINWTLAPDSSRSLRVVYRMSDWLEETGRWALLATDSVAYHARACNMYQTRPSC